jgi:trans-aconitate methyltransferase
LGGACRESLTFLKIFEVKKMKPNNTNDISSAQFDKYAENYDAELSSALHVSKNYDLSTFARYKIDIVKKEQPQSPASLLEFGCGTGRNIPFLQACYPNAEIHGCDISEQSLDVAKTNAPAAVFKKIMTPRELVATYAGKVDLVFISNVFHHIPFVEHKAWAKAINDIFDCKSTNCIKSGGGGGKRFFFSIKQKIRPQIKFS